ncbi:MAG TPA: type I secretion system permease/ATPase [Clostridia bacterium]
MLHKIDGVDLMIESVEEKNDQENIGESNKKTVDPGLYCLITIARFHGINANPEQIMHAFAIGADGMKELDILRAGKELGLKTKAANADFDNLKKMTLPAIVGTNDSGFIILAKVDDQKVLVLYPGENAPQIMATEKFRELWNGRIMLFVQKSWKQSDQKFGIKWFIPSIIKYKKPLIEVLVAALTLQILGLFSPIITQVVIDKVLVHHGVTTLDVLALGLALIAIFEMVMGMARSYIFTHTTSRIDIMLGSRLFKHLFSLPLRYFEVRRVGDTIARVRELENIRQFLTGTPLTSALDLMFMIVYVAVMLFYSTTLTWVVLASLPVFVALSAFVTPLFKQRLDEKFNCGAEYHSYLVESVTGVQTVKSFALEPVVQKKWEGLLADYIKAGFKTAILAGNANAVGQFIQKVADLAILWFGAHLVMDGNISVGQLIAFRMLSGRMSGPVLRLVQMWQDFQQTGISIKRLGDIFNTKPEPTIDSSKARLPAINGNIRFEKVRFRYRADSSEVIRDMSFDIKPGTVVGVVGRSGSGKSTISKLIQRLYIPEAGKILIDGVDISLADPAWLRSQIGVVLQENFLFNMSVRENIAVHNPTASMADVIRVAKVAGAHEFILELPEGYDTMVGEKGTGLSGGQKQRIAIARALLNNPRILIFDEATSALDYESESIIQRNLKMICQGRTVMIIAHRLSTLKDAHKIMAIDKGQLVEYGGQEELLKKKGLYYYLHSQQERGNVC